MWPDVTPKHSPDYLPVAVERPSTIVLIGVWMLLLPGAVVAPTIIGTMPGLFWLEVACVAISELCCAVGLFVVTRNYLRHRRARRPVK